MQFGDYIQYLLALVFVLALIGLITVVVKRFGMPGAIGGRRTARIAVLEATPVDKRRRLLLIRRDNVEHLVMIGGTQDFVVENGIPHNPSSKTEPAQPQQPFEAYPPVEADTAPRRGRRPPMAPAQADRLPPEPRLEMPRQGQSRRPQGRMPEPDFGDLGARRPGPANPEQSYRDALATPRNAERKLADAGNRPVSPEMAPYRAASAASATAGPDGTDPEEHEPYDYDSYDYREQYIPDEPSRDGPDTQRRLPDTAVKPDTAEPQASKPVVTAQSDPKQAEAINPGAAKPRAIQAGMAKSRLAQPAPGPSRMAPGGTPQDAAKPQEQQRSADQEQERPAATKRARPYSLTEKLQQTRQQIPGRQPPSNQRFEPTMQAPMDQPQRQQPPVTDDSGPKKPAPKEPSAPPPKTPADPFEGS